MCRAAPQTLAVLLGHELAHFYKDHGWGADFGQAFADLEIGKTVRHVSPQEMASLEAEADYFGGLYGYLAGYSTLEVAPRVLEAIYTAYHVDASLRGYPSLAERQVIAERSAHRLRQMIPIFDAATYLPLVQQYDLAAQVFDYLAQTFPSREILNNAGVAHALEALSLVDLDAEGRRFLYPFELDTETRLSGEHSRGAASDVETAAARRQQLLQEAQEAFARAKDRDPRYVTAVVNLAAVYDLQGKQDMALGFATEALDLAQHTGEPGAAAHALLVRGIALAHQGALDQARAAFEAAQAEHPVLARHNLGVLQRKEGPPSPTGMQPRTMSDETIAGLAIDDLSVMRPADATMTLPGPDAAHPALLVRTRQHSHSRGILIETADRVILVLLTGQGYTEASARGITVGASLADVETQYGPPLRVMAVRQGMYHVYEQPRIIFLTDAHGTVRGWMLYGF